MEEMFDLEMIGEGIAETCTVGVSDGGAEIIADGTIEGCAVGVTDGVMEGMFDMKMSEMFMVLQYL